MQHTAGGTADVARPSRPYRATQHDDERPVNGTPVQRKVEKDKLNIIGEDHAESEKVRTDEQEFARKELGLDGKRPAASFYWLEHEFSKKASAEQPHEFGFALGVKFNEYGDRPDLKARQHMLYLDRDLALVQGYLQTNVWPEGEKQKAPARIVGHARSAQIVLQLLTESFSERDDAKNVIAQGDVIDLFGGMITSCKALQTQSTEDLASLRVRLRRLMKAVGDELATGREGDAMKTAISTMAEQRSAHMFDIAAESQRVGVWKVGEDHIDHMMPLKDDAPNAEFTERGTFQDELKKFIEAKKGVK